MAFHRVLAGTSLHDPKGKYPTPLTLADATAAAYHIRRDDGGGGFYDVLKVNSSAGAVRTIHGNDALVTHTHEFNGPLQNKSERIYGYAAVSSTPFSVTAAHHFLAVDTSTAKTVQLGDVSGQVNGRILIIADVGGAAGQGNPVTIAAAGGDTINGLTSWPLDVNYGIAIVIKTAVTDWLAWTFSPQAGYVLTEANAILANQVYG